MKNFLVFYFIIQLCIFVGYGQSVLPVQSLRVHTTLPAGSVSNNLSEIPPSQLSSFLATANLECTFMLTVVDTIGISQIQVKFGHTLGASDITQKTFSFDGPSTNADGTTYKRIGNTIWLGLGNFSNLGNYYAEARLQDTNGVWTAGTVYHK